MGDPDISLPEVMQFMKYCLSLLLLLFSLSLSIPASAHVDTMGASKWYFGKNNIVADIELGPALVAEFKGIKEGHYLIETCSDEEFREVVTKVIQPYINEKLSITVNDTPRPAKVTRVNRKSDILWEIWLAVDNAGFDKPVSQVKIDYRLLFDETDDMHMNLAYIYSYDAAAQAVPENMPESAFITRNDFDANSHVWEASVKGTGMARAPSGKSLWGNIAEFILSGITHILTGYDHIAFLLALIVIGLSVREVLKIITAFTIAHSITLLLATLQIISLNSRFVEIVIALSICYVALENLFRKKVAYRWLITFGFGLIHGFGFASGLQELIVGKSDLLVSVLSFNLGVETGQLMIFFIMLPVLHLLNKRFEFRRITVVISVAVFAIGFTWLVERVFNLNLWSF
ncbi:MAG: HupE/UreJ family protein [Geobacter sp.]|nr:HupE/UreJ family protein [Geobacter sp.]